jgi:hypothetical protein
MARTVFRMSSLGSSRKSPGYQRSRTIPLESTRKNARWASFSFGRRTPYWRITLESGKSLRSGYGSLRESANVFCAKGLLELIPRIWTPSASNWL